MTAALEACRETVAFWEKVKNDHVFVHALKTAYGDNFTLHPFGSLWGVPDFVARSMLAIVAAKHGTGDMGDFVRTQHHGVASTYGAAS